MVRPVGFEPTTCGLEGLSYLLIVFIKRLKNTLKDKVSLNQSSAIY